MRAIYLTQPHAQLIWSGTKRAVVRPPDAPALPVAQPLILVGAKQALGQCVLGQGVSVPADDFNDSFPAHRVTIRERCKWWPDAVALVVYPIRDFQPFAQPLPVAVPPGAPMLWDDLSFTQPVPAPAANDGIMVAGVVPETAALTLALPAILLPAGSEAQAPADLHLTLAYLGDVPNATFDRVAVEQALQDFALTHGPLVGEIAGLGRFVNTHKPGLDALVALYDCPDLPRLRQELVDTLALAGAPVDKAHGFLPHITLAYVPHGEPVDVDISAVPLTIGALDLAWGNDHMSIALQGTPAAVKAFPNEHAARLADPADFLADSFRRKQIAAGISLVLAKRKADGESGPMEAQSYRFDRAKFTAQQARKWLADHRVKPILFETAGDAEESKMTKVQVADVDAILGDLEAAVKGGPGSGFFGHAGRPGHVGGSSSGSSAPSGKPRGGTEAQRDATFSRIAGAVIGGPFSDLPTAAGEEQVYRATDADGKPKPRRYLSGPKTATISKGDMNRLLIEAYHAGGGKRSESPRVDRVAAKHFGVNNLRSGDLRTSKFLISADVLRQAMHDAYAAGAFESMPSSRNKALPELATGVKTFTARDGRAWLLTWTTNAFQDREGEIFTTKSLEDYVQRHEADPVKNRFWFWHIKGTDFGDVRWQGVVGRMLVEAGTFDQSAKGQAFEKFFTAHPHGHPVIAPEGWGCSHGYTYAAADRADRVYEWFDKKETTLLPLSAASNPFTKLEVKMALSQKQRAALTTIGGDELLHYVEETGDATTKALEAEGIAYKALPEQTYADLVREAAKEIADAALQTEILTLADQLEAEEKARKPKPAEEEAAADEETTDEEDATDEETADEEAATDEEAEPVPPKKNAKPTKLPPFLARKLKWLANEADSPQLDALADELAAVDAELPDAATKQVEEQSFAYDVKALVAEVADALQLEQLSTIMTAQTTAIQAIGAAVKALQEAVPQLATRLDAYAEKAAAPAPPPPPAPEPAPAGPTSLPRFAWFRPSQADMTADKSLAPRLAAPAAIAGLAAKMTGDIT